MALESVVKILSIHWTTRSTTNFPTAENRTIAPLKGALTIALCLLAGCSFQQQRDKAERQWLQTKAIQSAVHRVELVQTGVPDAGDRSLTNARYASTQLVGQLNSPEIKELSGLAPVQGSDGKYWAINDSGNQPRLFAISEQGQLLGATNLPVINRDWEDIASFTSAGDNWLLVADTGDNLRRRAVSSIYFFKQPDISNLPQSQPLHHRIDFNYEGGPSNVESMAVSLIEKKIFLIAKENGAPAVYSLPLLLNKKNQSLTAVKVGSLHELFTTNEDKWWERVIGKRFLIAPTAFDISADDRLAVVANYRHAYLFRRDADESWQAAFSRKPQVLLTHRMEQSESIAFSANSERVIVSSEGVHAPVLVVRSSLPDG